jgi:hypothetical protein
MFILIYIILGILALTVEGQSQFTTSEDGSVSLFAPKNKLKLRSSVTSTSNPTFTINGDLLVVGSVGISGTNNLLQYIKDNCVLKDENGNVNITGNLTVDGIITEN